MSALSFWLHVNPFMGSSLGISTSLPLISTLDADALMHRNSRERMHALSFTADREAANHLATPRRVDGNGIAEIVVARNIAFGRHKFSCGGRGILP